jgi:ubiquitin-protein ligase
MQARCSARLKKEAEDINKNYQGVLELEIKNDNWSLWHDTFKGAEGSVYAGEANTLQSKF